jgi:hypothetical protein
VGNYDNRKEDRKETFAVVSPAGQTALALKMLTIEKEPEHDEERAHTKGR